MRSQGKEVSFKLKLEMELEQLENEGADQQDIDNVRDQLDAEIENIEQAGSAY